MASHKESKKTQSKHGPRRRGKLSACRAAIGQTFRLICCRWWQKDCRMMNYSAAGEHMHVCRQGQMTWWPLTLQSCVQAMASGVLPGCS